MGIISVKLSTNYDYLPIDAAQAYVEKHRTKTFQLPKVDYWELVEGVDLYDKGFGVVGKLVNDDSSQEDEYIGFSVCFLLNQTSGVDEAVKKSAVIQTANGDLTAGMEKIAVTVALEKNAEKANISGQVYLDAAKAALNKMNEINQSGSDYEFDYQFNLSETPLWGNSGSSKYPLQYDDPGYANRKLGQRIPIGNGNDSAYEYTIDGKTYSLPGFYGSSIVWNQGSGTSFFEATVWPKTDTKEDIQQAITESIDECYNNQKQELEELLQQINEKAEEEAKMAAMAAAKAAKAAKEKAAAMA